MKKVDIVGPEKKRKSVWTFLYWFLNNRGGGVIKFAKKQKKRREIRKNKITHNEKARG